MSKHEQERRIETLKEQQAQFQNPRQSVEHVPDACKSSDLRPINSRSAADALEDGDQHDTSGDEEASEESEEE